MTTTWKLPRETREWVGPLTPFATDLDTGQDIPLDPANIKFAVLDNDTRPDPDGTDWTVPVVDPEGGDAIGVQAEAVAEYTRQGIWAQITSGANIIVLEPGDVGFITRT